MGFSKDSFPFYSQAILPSVHSDKNTPRNTKLNPYRRSLPFFSFFLEKLLLQKHKNASMNTNTHRETLKYTQTPDSPAEAETTRLSWQPSCKGVIGQGNDVLRNVCCKGVCKFATHRGNVLRARTHKTHTHTHSCSICEAEQTAQNQHIPNND